MDPNQAHRATYHLSPLRPRSAPANTQCVAHRQAPGGLERGEGCPLRKRLCVIWSGWVQAYQWLAGWLALAWASTGKCAKRIILLVRQVMNWQDAIVVMVEPGWGGRSVPISSKVTAWGGAASLCKYVCIVRSTCLLNFDQKTCPSGRPQGYLIFHCLAPSRNSSSTVFTPADSRIEPDKQPPALRSSHSVLLHA